MIQTAQCIGLLLYIASYLSIHKAPLKVLAIQRPFKGALSVSAQRKEQWSSSNGWIRVYIVQPKSNYGWKVGLIPHRRVHDGKRTVLGFGSACPGN